LIFFYFKLIFLIFLNYFDTLILKKNIYIYIYKLFNIFTHKKNALKNNSYRLPKSIIVYLPSRFSKKKGENKIKTCVFWAAWCTAVIPNNLVSQYHFFIIINLARYELDWFDWINQISPNQYFIWLNYKFNIFLRSVVRNKWINK
jgi:hypothetical protein